MKRTVIATAAACLLLLPAALVTAADLVINEVDYDQPSTDTAEFLELKNVSAVPIDLTNYVVELVNGTGGGATVYVTITLPAVTLSAGDYYVICANPANTIHCDLDVSPDTNLIQNGAPDAIGLRDPSGNLIDAVSYEGDTGAPYTEGSGVGLEDSTIETYAGISRYPDGTDTDQNNVDFSYRCITPGAANTADDTNCLQPVAAGGASWGTIKARFQ
jgi:hypothetical protein